MNIAPVTPADWAAWTQALAAILALIVAVGVPIWQRAKEQERRIEQICVSLGKQLTMRPLLGSFHPRKQLLYVLSLLSRAPLPDSILHPLRHPIELRLALRVRSVFDRFVRIVDAQVHHAVRF